MSKKILLIAFFLLFVSTSKSQQWKIWNTTNSNIPSDNLSCLILDSNGIIWIGSGAGLIKFNGTNFTVYDTSNSPMKSNSVWGIDKDKFNNLWISTIRVEGQSASALMKFDRVNNWSFYNTQNSGISNDNQWCVKVDTNNIVWSGHNELNKFNGASWYIYDSTNSPLEYSAIREIFVDRQNNKWMENIFFGLYKLTNDTSWKIYTPNNSGLLGGLIPKIREDNFGNMWISVNGGINKFDPVKNEWQSWTPENSNIISYYPWGLCISRNNTKWIGFGNNAPLSEFNDTTFIPHFAPVSTGAPQPNIWDIKEDKYGNLWLATKSGLMEFNKNGIVGISNQTSIVPDNFKIEKIYPNPFNPTTKIEFSIYKSSKVAVKIYDIMGKEIETLTDINYSQGNYEITWNAKNFSSGIYFVTFYINDNFFESRKILFVR